MEVARSFRAGLLLACVLVIFPGGTPATRPGSARQPPALGAHPTQQAQAAAAAVATVEIRSQDDQALRGVPVTFGQVFRKGDVPRGRQVQCLLDGRRAQIDAKRHYDDGSLRFAVVSAVIPELPARGTRILALETAPSTPYTPLPHILPSEPLEKGFDAVVTLRFPDGTVRSASVRRLLEQAGGHPQTWLCGDIATEWLLSGPPVDDRGTPDEDLEVRFQVRAYAGCRRARVSVVLENCSDQWAGNIRYDATIDVGGKEVFAVERVDHRRLSRWRKVFWSGGDEPAVHVAHDLAVLTGSGALPNYGNSYAYSARAAVICGIDAGFPRAREALERLDAHLPNHRQVVAVNPAWAIVPRQAPRASRCQRDQIKGRAILPITKLVGGECSDSSSKFG